MKFSDKTIKRLNKRPINPKIRICVECGSSLVSIDEKKITCRECGISKKFEGGMYGTQFNIGDSVKIIDSDKKNDLIYRINKIKKSEDDTIQFILKSESSDITLLYYESEDSFLEKV